MRRRLTQDEVIGKFKDTHGEKYNYMNTVYIKSSQKVNIICPTHGEFSQLPTDHMRGRGCLKCGAEVNGVKKRYTTEEFITHAINKHGDKFDYSKVNYTTSLNKVDIICKTHGIFSQLPSDHLTGKGCRLCQYTNQTIKLTSNTEDFIDKAKCIHGDRYDYSKVDYIDSYTKVCIICTEHGEFLQTPNLHINSRNGCVFCKNKYNGINLRSNTDEFIIKANKIHDNKYDYSPTSYITANDRVDIICPKHGTFTLRARQHIHNKIGCPSCSASESKPEKYIRDFLLKNNIKFIQNDRTQIKPKELDFYLPDHKLAIEYNGMYYHSEITGEKDKNYHLSKTEECKSLGIRLIHIFEDEYLDNPKLILTKLKHVLGLTKYKIYGRQCEIRVIDKKTKKYFLDKYHIQGDGNSCIDLGLYYKNRLVQVSTFTKRRIALGKSNTEGEFELSRMATINNFRVIGGASKLLKFFELNYKPKELVSYADKRWSVGDVYEKVGFTKSKDSKPNYWYFLINRNDKKWHRYMFAKHTLKDKLKQFDENLTEWDNMKNNGYDRIWDCGNLVYVKKYN